MKNILELLKSHKYAIIWTIFYVLLVWFILYFLFNFSIFNAAQWHKLARAELHGFAGFVFGLLILSALPLYIATTTLIIRNKKPLITIPTPKIALPKITKKTENNAPTPATSTEAAEEKEEKLPDELPPELHSIFIRMRNRISAYDQSIATMPDTPTPNIDIPETSNFSLPLPTDFDIELNDVPGTDNTTDFSVPVFTDITFEDNSAPTDNTEVKDINNKKMIEFLSNNNTPFVTSADIIATDTHAIITHSDSDFWVIDNENWFANGKTRPSPISQVQQFATKHNLTPVIYLESTNIMDLDTHVKSWKSNGIIVITSPEEL